MVEFKGLETLKLRIEKMQQNAIIIQDFLVKDSRIKKFTFLVMAKNQNRL